VQSASDFSLASKSVCVCVLEKHFLERHTVPAQCTHTHTLPIRGLVIGVISDTQLMQIQCKKARTQILSSDGQIVLGRFGVSAPLSPRLDRLGSTHAHTHTHVYMF